MAKPYFPAGRRAAVSLSFDDARPSQVDCGLALLERLDVRATFYVMPQNVEKHLEKWQRMVAAGHEIGNHTLLHPCTGNFPWARSRALEDYTLDRMAAELRDADAAIEKLLGVRTRTFGYPCGQTFVGRGRDTRSYVPLIAERFVVGRGFQGEAWNDPAWCDLAQAPGFNCDDLSFESLRDLVDGALDQNAWAILAGHDLGASGRQTTRVGELEKLCHYCRERSGELFLGTVADVGVAINAARTA